MATLPDNKDSSSESVQLRMHPRVFSALGKDLVTNDVVAVMELVKNAYDAFAFNVWLEFGQDENNRPYLEVRDDGVGMTKDVIENVWCLVATPYRKAHPIIERNGRKRRVVGEKGLGRLSVARLGERLTLLTQASKSPCWEITVDWSDIASKNDLSQSTVSRREYRDPSPFGVSGTKLQIIGLEEVWDETRIDDLRENLARLLSPFSEANDFNIFLSVSSEDRSKEVRIQSSEFLSKPKYSIEGSADSFGNVTATYRFSPIGENGVARAKEREVSWYNIRESVPASRRSRYSAEAASCGPFSFEIRAWDIGPDDTQEISDRFAIQKSLVRKAIRAHKGISVYRDGVLVLPKSDNARDWLGLDLRRVGRVGPRLSTSQLVGYVAITADNNQGIVDTSDRERLSASTEVAEFEEILMAIVKVLEGERNGDRITPGRERPMSELFARLSASELVSRVTDLAVSEAQASDTVTAVKDFAHHLDETRKTIEERFVYYSRLATVGTIAQMLIHEIRNRTTTFGSMLRLVKCILGPSPDRRTVSKVRRAEEAVDALEGLADRFAPLANRNFTRRRKRLVLEDRIRACVEMNEADIRSKGIKWCVPTSETVVVADPGELDTIILNLVMNASYWLGEVPRGTRNIAFELDLVGIGPRVHVSIHDSGPGIDAEDLERVFLPGVTRKPNGIGMGLNVASELVAIYGGEMKAMRHPTKMGGASLTFDLPMEPNITENQC